MQTSLTVLACARSFYLINMTLYIMVSVQIAQLNSLKRFKTHASFLSVNPEASDSATPCECKCVLCSQATDRINAHPYLPKANVCGQFFDHSRTDIRRNARQAQSCAFVWTVS